MGDLRVFLSHTSDLDESSGGHPSPVQTALRTIAVLKGFSVEEQSLTFSAEDAPSAEVVRRRLNRCDVYLAIVGVEPGSRVQGDPTGRSFVELEFDLAGQQGIPRIVLVWEPVDARAPALAAGSLPSRLASSQEAVFKRCGSHAELRSEIERALVAFQPAESAHVSCHVEWASPAELSELGIDPRDRRWAVYVRNASEYPAHRVLATVHSNNGGRDQPIDFGTVAAGDVKNSPYVLNEEVASFDPDGDRPAVELRFALARLQWHQRPDGSMVRDRTSPNPRTRGPKKRRRN